MLLAIDVGNTEITLGFFRGRRLAGRDRIPTHGAASYIKTLPRILRKNGIQRGNLEGVIVSSVAPEATVRLKRALREIGAPKPVIVGETIRAPVVNRYRIPSQVGQDRLVNAVAAMELYGGPAVVVDFGTAITIDIVTARREYLGGLIVPGMGIALETLIRRAALLPAIDLKPPREFLGRTTVGSMRSGIFYGYSALVDGIVHRMKVAYAPKATVIATGGHSRLIAPFCRTIQKVDPNLTLKGLALIYRNFS